VAAAVAAEGSCTLNVTARSRFSFKTIRLIWWSSVSTGTSDNDPIIRRMVYQVVGYYVTRECASSAILWCRRMPPCRLVGRIYTVVNRKKHTKIVFLLYSLQNLTYCDKIWYMLSWVNLSYRNVNVFRLTWIVSLLDLVKLGIRILQVNSSYNCEPKNTPNVLPYFYETKPILVRFGTCFPD